METNHLRTVTDAGAERYRVTATSALSRTASIVALAGLLLAATACSSPSSQASIGTQQPADQTLRTAGLDVRVTDVSPVPVNIGTNQRYVVTYQLTNPVGGTEAKVFRSGRQVLFANGKEYPANKEATDILTDHGLMNDVMGGATEQTKVVFDLPKGADVTGLGIYMHGALMRVGVPT